MPVGGLARGEGGRGGGGGGDILNLSYDGGRSKCPSIFICENNSKSNKIMHCVEKKNLLVV